MRSERASRREFERRYGVSRAVLAREVAAGRLPAERIGPALAPLDADVRRVVSELLKRALAAEVRPGGGP